MSDRQALIEAIREHPEDDTPRLVLADWYDESGESARGEFVRVQCELARLDPASARYPELHVRQLQLLAEHEAEWLGEWSERLVRWEFRRGMLDEVAIRPEPYCAAGESLFRDHPIWRVAFVDGAGESLEPGAVRDVLTQPHSRCLRAIDAAGCRPGEQAEAMFGGQIHTNSWLSELARATALKGLRELSLFGGTRSGRDDIDLKTWQKFCVAGHLRGLQHLDLSNLYDYHGHSGSWEPVLSELAGAAFASALQSLRFDGCYVVPEALVHLTRSRRFRRLRTLSFGGPTTDLSSSEVLSELLNPDVLPALQDLSIPYGRHLTGVIDHPGWGRLERIRLVGSDDNRVRDPETHRPIWRAFFRSAHLKPTAFHVQSPGYYNLAAAGFWDELVGAAWFGDLRELAIGLYHQSCAPLFDRSLEGFPQLRSLSLSPDTDLVERLAAWPGLEHLTELSLNDSFNATAPGAAVQLFNSPHLTPRLGRLRVSGICRSPEAVSALAECPALIGLQHLDFAFNELSRASVEAMIASPYLRNLRSLHTWSEWDRESTGGSNQASSWLLLADRQAFPRLRDVVIGSGSSEIQTELARRFGPRLRVFMDC
ncbi:hypothetical protein FTUN_8428 [Frigoriglobus tundricola]|uniref:Repeat-companion domain protein n=2 Tax=Frigoriglobus tundricola TaxID=2774151 RepID=A0A6M5Z2Y3_9BACT|nr:hypothetical protein FTUN_8428 [Frigoriglobus tundricola]